MHNSKKGGEDLRVDSKTRATISFPLIQDLLLLHTHAMDPGVARPRGCHTCPSPRHTHTAVSNEHVGVGRVNLVQQEIMHPSCHHHQTHVIHTYGWPFLLIADDVSHHPCQGSPSSSVKGSHQHPPFCRLAKANGFVSSHSVKKAKTKLAHQHNTRQEPLFL